MFDAIIARQAHRRPGAPAVLLPGRRVSFAELDADVDRAAALCMALDVPDGEAVALAIGDPYRHLQVMLALARIGVASAQGDDEGCRFRISDAGTPAGPGTLHLPSQEAGRALAGPRPTLAAVRRDPDGAGRIVTTSGTTGERKRIAVSWRVLEERIRNAGPVYGDDEGPRIAATGVESAYGFSITMTCWASGNPIVLGLDGLDAGMLARIRPALVAVIPDQLRRFIDHLPADHAPGAFKVVTAGGLVPPALARQARLRLTSRLLSIYGTTETGLVAVAQADEIEARPGLAGRVVPATEVGIVNDAGRPLPRGASGHVRIRSGRDVPGYLDDPSRTRRNFRDGWFHPGDLGHLSEDGLLFIDGRSDDLMNLAGHKVLPRWIEEAALACPGVRDAGAFSLRDPDGLERCWLALVCGSGFSPGALGRAMRDQLRWLTAMKLLFVDQIPRNAMGKIERGRLRVEAERRAGGA